MWFVCILWLLILLYCLSVKNYNYWKIKKVPHIKPSPLFGNYTDYILLKTFNGNVAKSISEKLPNEPYVGSYYGTAPALIVPDAELLKLIFLKDFYYFHGREASAHSTRDPMGNNMFLTQGDTWKVLRQNFSPLFTTAKMKNMFPLIVKCTQTFEKYMEDNAYTNNKINVNALTASFTVDCVASCVFGVEANALTNQSNSNPYITIGKAIFDKTTSQGMKHVIRSMWPSLFYALGFSIFTLRAKSFFLKVFSEMFMLRNYEPSTRKDFIDFIISICKNNKMSGSGIIKHKTGDSQNVEIEVDNNLLTAQCLSFFGAGFETSASTLAFTLFEIAKNGQVQEMVLKEVHQYFQKHNNELFYDCVTELPYLEACIDEALRLFPSLTLLSREVMEDYTFPTGLRVEKGTRIHIPVYYIQHAAKNFPEPERFRPERFLPEERHKIKPYTYLPFGEGHRMCLAIRFAKMQMLAGLVTIFKNYKIQLAEGMPETVDIDPRVMISQTTEPIYLKFIRLDNN